MIQPPAAARSWAIILGIIILAAGARRAPRSGAQPGSGWRRLSGHIPPAAWTSNTVSAVAPQEPVELALTLPLRNEEELDNLLQRLYDPQDPLYGQFLTPAEFTERYAPTEAEYEVVAAFATSQGLAITGTPPNRLLLDVAAPAAVVERAFGTHLHWFRAASGRIFRAPVFEPAVPAALAGTIAGIAGLRTL